jgi:hypothetical protein
MSWPAETDRYLPTYGVRSIGTSMLGASPALHLAAWDGIPPHECDGGGECSECKVCLFCVLCSVFCVLPVLYSVLRMWCGVTICVRCPHSHQRHQKLFPGLDIKSETGSASLPASSFSCDRSGPLMSDEPDESCEATE